MQKSKEKFLRATPFELCARRKPFKVTGTPTKSKGMDMHLQSAI